MDEGFWYELIYDDNCVGINQYGDGWWPGLDVNGDPVDPTRPVNDDNVICAQQGMWGGMTAPRLVVTIVPEPAALSLLALGAVAVIRRRRR